VKASFAVGLTLAAMVAASSAWAAGPPDGNYNCFVWLNGIANKVGAVSIAGATYVAKADKGSYGFDGASKTMTFKGPPPLGYKVGVLETTSNGKTAIRMYKEAENIGKKWGAILCTPQN